MARLCASLRSLTTWLRVAATVFLCMGGVSLLATVLSLLASADPGRFHEGGGGFSWALGLMILVRLLSPLLFVAGGLLALGAASHFGRSRASGDGAAATPGFSRVNICLLLHATMSALLLVLIVFVVT